MNPLLMAILQQQVNLALWRNIIGYWKLDDNAASATVLDASGNGYNGTLCKADGSVTNRNTNTASVAAKINSGFEYRTSGTFDQKVGVRVADNNVFTFGNGTIDSPFSIGCWVYLRSWGTASGTLNLTFLFTKRYATADGSEYNFVIREDTTGGTYDISFGVFSGKNTTNLLTRRGAITSGFLNAWHYVLATYDGSGTVTGIKIYMDGEALSYTNVTAGTYVAMDNTISDVGIGTFALDALTNNFAIDGIQDEVALWGRELSAADAASLYSYGAGRNFYK